MVAVGTTKEKTPYLQIKYVYVYVYEAKILKNCTKRKNTEIIFGIY